MLTIRLMVAKRWIGRLIGPFKDWISILRTLHPSTRQYSTGGLLSPDPNKGSRLPGYVRLPNFDRGSARGLGLEIAPRVSRRS